MSLTPEKCLEVINKGARNLLDYCVQNNIHNLVTGVSGGADSAVTLGFCYWAKKMGMVEDYRLNIFGLIMPCESKPEAEILAREAIEKFEAIEIKVDLSQSFRALKGLMFDELDDKLQCFIDEQPNDRAKKIAYGNIKARLRMITCYHVAKKLNGLVLTNDNLSEYWMGFWTICGDVGDFGLIQHIMKGLELYDIARYLGVPQGIIDAKPDDGLGIAGGDEDQLGAPYPIVDKVMVALIQAGFDTEGDKSQLASLPAIEGVDPAVTKNLATRTLGTAFKRKGTITLSREDLGLPPIMDIKL
ncbi:MAG: NAD(+) synthase [Candidatus Parcubacteria bacterium]|nr:NAD(+) synthase [Candidatus Parcubacteria bacterium]